MTSDPTRDMEAKLVEWRKCDWNHVIQLRKDAADTIAALREQLEAAKAELALVDKSPEYWHRRAKDADAALTEARAQLEEAEASIDLWQQNSWDTWAAMQAMRDTINEHLPMPSMESDLLHGPGNSVFCAAVAEAVVLAVTESRAREAKAWQTFLDRADADLAETCEYGAYQGDLPLDDSTSLYQEGAWEARRRVAALVPPPTARVHAVTGSSLTAGVNAAVGKIRARSALYASKAARSDPHAEADHNRHEVFRLLTESMEWLKQEVRSLLTEPKE